LKHRNFETVVAVVDYTVVAVVVEEDNHLKIK
jgi:hypothetical protein